MWFIEWLKQLFNKSDDADVPSVDEEKKDLDEGLNEPDPIYDPDKVDNK